MAGARSSSPATSTCSTPCTDSPVRTSCPTPTQRAFANSASRKRSKFMSSATFAPPVAVTTKLHHVVDTQQFTVPLLMELFDRTRQMEKIVARGGTLDYQ